MPSKSNSLLPLGQKWEQLRRQLISKAIGGNFHSIRQKYKCNAICPCNPSSGYHLTEIWKLEATNKLINKLLKYIHRIEVNPELK